MRGLYDECLAVAEAAGEPVPEAAQDTARGTLTQAGSALKASMLRDLEAGQQVEAEQIVGDMLARARKATRKPCCCRSPTAACRPTRHCAARELHLRRQCIALGVLILGLGWSGLCAGPTSAGIGRTRRRHGTRSSIGTTRWSASPSAGCRCHAHRPPCSMRSRRPRPCCAACHPMPMAILHCACCCPRCGPARHCAGWAICRPPRCMPTAPAAGSTSAARPMH